MIEQDSWGGVGGWGLGLRRASDVAFVALVLAGFLSLLGRPVGADDLPRAAVLFGTGFLYVAIGTRGFACV